MGALGNPKAWIPYMNSKECTQKICSLSCPQWCYLIFPPPPPLDFPEDKSQTRLTFSPLVIAIIGTLVSGFLLVSYYAIVSKYFGNYNSSRRGENDQHPNEDEENSHNDHDFSQHEPWLIRTNGLDEALIKSITLVKYKKAEGLIGSTNCSICLGEFLEDDNLRLLPKCSHSFHVACIDTWLKSHSNCPLCRVNIVSGSMQPVQSPSQDHVSLSQNQVTNEVSSSNGERSGISSNRPFQAFSERVPLRQGTLLAHVGHHGGKNVTRRSISMDHSHETSVSIAEILKFSHGDDCQVYDQSLEMTVDEESSSSKSDFGNTSTSRNGRLFGVMNSAGMKRSFSSGRFCSLCITGVNQ